ncbi:DUF4129 domain-containing transglutaminase family protein [Bacillaceae bacterium]
MEADKETHAWLTRLVEWLILAATLLMLREWFIPLETVTDTQDADVFFLFAAVLFVLDLFPFPLFLRWTAKALFTAFVIHRLFFELPFFSPEWLRILVSDLGENRAALFQQQWFVMSPLSRTTLFLLLLWFSQGVLFYHLLRRARGLWFFLVTVVYLATLDTFTSYDADLALVRCLVFGFVLLTVLNFYRLRRQWAFALRGKPLFSWLAAAGALVSLTVVVALAGPKAAPSWPDPVAWVQEVTGQPLLEQTTKIRIIGYGENDSRLGGSLLQDDAVVFRAYTDRLHYWRGEAKDLYTGKGWERSERDAPYVPVRPGGPVLFQNLRTVPVEQRVAFVDGGYRTFFYGGQVRAVEGVSPTGLEVKYQPEYSHIQAFPRQDGSAQGDELEGYTLIAEIPVLEAEKLQAAGNTYPPEVLQRYLQLPGTLPERVRELAREVTKGAGGPYGKAKAIEDYLRYGPFLYDTINVPVPASHEDYVDQFLFESKRGYCDNFSTAMVVMLRAVGIPARWVKGFTAGDAVWDDAAKKYVSTVRQKHAHSWPEAYFAGIGWIPFEPTPSFSQPLEVEGETAVQEPAIQPERAQTEEEKETRREQGNASDATGKWAGLVSFVLIAAGLAFLLLAISLAAFQVRRPRKRLGDAGQNGSVPEPLPGTFLQEFFALLRTYEKQGMIRKPSQTVREYVRGLTLRDGEEKARLLKLTKIFEEFRYGKGARQAGGSGKEKGSRWRIRGRKR